MSALETELPAQQRRSVEVLVGGDEVGGPHVRHDCLSSLVDGRVGNSQVDLRVSP
jgi:hypothetical protein